MLGNFQINSVNPNLFFLGFLLLVVLTGAGEYVHIVPSGTFAVLVGSVFGGTIAHASYALGNNQAAKVVDSTIAAVNSSNGNGGNGNGTSTIGGH